MVRGHRRDTGNDNSWLLAKSTEPLFQKNLFFKNKEAIVENFYLNDVEKIMLNLIVLLKTFGSNGYFVGNEVSFSAFTQTTSGNLTVDYFFVQLTWADIYVYQVVSILKLKNDGFLSDYPELVKNREQVESNERIKRYLKKRDQKAEADKTQ